MKKVVFAVCLVGAVLAAGTALAGAGGRAPGPVPAPFDPTVTHKSWVQVHGGGPQPNSGGGVAPANVVPPSR